AMGMAFTTVTTVMTGLPPSFLSCPSFYNGNSPAACRFLETSATASTPCWHGEDAGGCRFRPHADLSADVAVLKENVARLPVQAHVGTVAVGRRYAVATNSAAHEPVAVAGHRGRLVPEVHAIPAIPGGDVLHEQVVRVLVPDGDPDAAVPFQ